MVRLDRNRGKSGILHFLHQRRTDAGFFDQDRVRPCRHWRARSPALSEPDNQIVRATRDQIVFFVMIQPCGTDRVIVLLAFLGSGVPALQDFMMTRDRATGHSDGPIPA